jgi:hypothetical protein
MLAGPEAVYRDLRVRLFGRDHCDCVYVAQAQHFFMGLKQSHLWSEELPGRPQAFFASVRGRDETDLAAFPEVSREVTETAVSEAYYGDSGSGFLSHHRLLPAGILLEDCRGVPV